jgi:hypothetical protein
MTEPEPARTTPEPQCVNCGVNPASYCYVCYSGMLAPVEPAPTTPEPMTDEEMVQRFGEAPPGPVAPPEDERERLVAEMRKVIMCLRLEVEPSIANDVQARFEEVAALLAQKNAEIGEVWKTIRAERKRFGYAQGDIQHECGVLKAELAEARRYLGHAKERDRERSDLLYERDALRAKLA